MAIIKLTKSKKAIQFICDEGVVYQTSIPYIKGLLEGKGNVGVLTRFPLKVSKDRFKQSPIWNNGNLEEVDELSLNNDSLSKKSIDERTQSKDYEDVIVW